MNTLYAVVNEYERDKFEKEWQLPYGYKDCFITTDPREAIEMLKEICEGENEASEMIVEKISTEWPDFGRELYFRI